MSPLWMLGGYQETSRVSVVTSVSDGQSGEEAAEQQKGWEYVQYWVNRYIRIYTAILPWELWVHVCHFVPSCAVKCLVCTHRLLYMSKPFLVFLYYIYTTQMYTKPRATRGQFTVVHPVIRRAPLTWRSCEFTSEWAETCQRIVGHS